MGYAACYVKSEGLLPVCRRPSSAGSTLAQPHLVAVRVTPYAARVYSSAASQGTVAPAPVRVRVQLIGHARNNM